MDWRVLKSVVEGVIFSVQEPIAVEALVRVIQGVGKETVQAVLDELEEEYRSRSRGFVLCKVAGGYQFRSLPDVAPWILEIKKIKPSRLSRAAMEILSIIAYNQPITKTRIEQIRGVESSAPIKSLIERDLILVVGRKDIAGRPLLYGTSKRFLEVFGLTDLTALPPLPELEDLEEPEE